MMRSILLGILAVVVAMIVAGLVVGLIESTNLLLYPELAEKAGEAPEELKADDIPPGALVTVLLAWCVGAAVGSATAAAITAKLARKNSLIPAYVFGVLFLLACTANLFMIPHPIWMAVLGIVGPAAIVMVSAKWTLKALYRRPVTASSENQSPGKPIVRKLDERDRTDPYVPPAE